MVILAGILSNDAYTFLIIPLLIFIARIADVSIGTIRIIFISKGFKNIAPFLAFFEIIIWLAAIQQIMLNLTNIYCYLAYALGFASGTYAGILLEEKISVGKVMIRIITGHDSSKLVKALKEEHYTFTTIGAAGPDGKVKLIFSVINRQSIPGVVNTVKRYNPGAFYSIEDIRYSINEISHIPPRRRIGDIFSFPRKGK